MDILQVRNFFIKDVRCFAEEQALNIRPITFIVGENSTGKSTVLGCLQIMYNFLVDRKGLDFNAEPYQMGAFADIARQAKPKKEEFCLGIKIGEKEQAFHYSLTLSERIQGSEPVVKEQKIVLLGGDELIFRRESDLEQSVRKHNDFPDLDVKTETQGKKFFIDIGGKVLQKSLSYCLMEKFPHDLREKLEGIWEVVYRIPNMHSFAPIRSQPQRTYNPLREELSPEGGETPMVLMNLSASRERQWSDLKDRLIKFGKASGLFTGIDVRKLGKSSNDPFQLQIKIRGPKVNLINVGYGVNQILPILVRMLTAKKNAYFLIQQPEVHLHPRGQAELSSLLVELYKEKRHHFVIESHSDYMIDRVRIEIAKGRIVPEDVSLVYMEPSHNKVLAHNIKFDKRGNLINAPSGYRDFFLKETDRLLGLDED